MRPHRACLSSRHGSPLQPFAEGSVWTRGAKEMKAAASQAPAVCFADQMNYGRTAAEYAWKKEAGKEAYGGKKAGEAINANLKEYTPAVYIVGPNQPTQKVTFVNAAGEPQPAGESGNLQEPFNAVPMPLVALVPSGRLSPLGTDEEVVILQYLPNGKIRMWEMWRLKGSEGAYTFRFGAYVEDTTVWDGIFTNGWGARACGLACMGGLITMQDIGEVLRGGAIKHALGLSLMVTLPSFVGPATRCDAVPGENTHEYLENGTTPNPAFGSVDGVAEGTRLRMPPGSTAAEHGLTKPLEVALFNAMRDYGIIINDKSGTPSFYIQSPVSMGSPYHPCLVNPFAGATALNPGQYGYVNEIAPSWMTDPTTPTLAERISTESGMWFKQPWEIMEVCEAQTS